MTVDGHGRASVNMYGSTTVNDRQHGVQGRTDSNGFYIIARLPEGTVQLNAGLNDGTQQRNLNTSVVVALGTVTDCDFNFVSANSSVEGYIMLPENQPSSDSAQLQVDTGAGTESRYMEVWSDAHYLFENVPAGRVTLRGHSANPRDSKLVSADLSENEALRLDVSLFGGVTVLVTVENAPAGQFTQIVALPANYPVPTTMSMEALQSMSQDSIQYASGVGGGGDLGFQFMEAGNYTVVAMSFESSQDGPNFDDGGITSTQLSVGGDADVSVSLSF